MHRFYCPDLKSPCTELTFNDIGEIHHIRDVLRLKPNDTVYLFNGKGEQAQGTIRNLNPHQIRIEIQKIEEVAPRSPRIVLACAMPKKSKFEMIIEKATELGVDEIIPLKTERSEVDISGEKMPRKLERFQTIALNAAKQSQRSFIPTVHAMQPFETCLNDATKNSFVIIPSLLGERKNFLETLENLKSPNRITVFIGPEGDFTKKEYESAFKKGALSVSLGESVLKVETAALCSLSVLLMFYNTNQ